MTSPSLRHRLFLSYYVSISHPHHRLKRLMLLLRYGDISIFKMAAVRHLGIVLPPYEITWIVRIFVNVNVNLYSASSQKAPLMHSYLAWNAYSGRQNGGFGGLLTHKYDYSSSRPPKGTSLRKSASFKLSTVKIRWGVWPVSELTESVTDTQTHKHIHTRVNLYSVHALHSIGQTTITFTTRPYTVIHLVSSIYHHHYHHHHQLDSCRNPLSRQW